MKKGKAKAEGAPPAEEVDRATLESFILDQGVQVQFLIKNFPGRLKSQESILLELYAQICQGLGLQHHKNLFGSSKKLVWKGDSNMGNIRDLVVQEMLKKLQPGASTSAPPKQGESSTSVSGEAHKGDDDQVVKVTDQLSRLKLDVGYIDEVVKETSSRTLDSFSNEALVAFLLQSARVKVKDEKILLSAVREFREDPDHSEIRRTFPGYVNSIAERIAAEQKAAKEIAAAKEETAAAKEETAAEREERIAAEQGKDLRVHGLPQIELIGKTQPSGATGNLDYNGVKVEVTKDLQVAPVSNFTISHSRISSVKQPVLDEPKVLAQIPLRSTIWYDAKGETFYVKDERDVGTHVQKVIEDILTRLGLDGFIQLNREAYTGNKRADFLLLYNKHRQPMGAVEVKSPLKNGGAIDPILHLPQLGTYLKNLRELFGVTQPIGILTTFREWCFCTLAEDGALIFGDPKSLTIRPWSFEDPPPPPYGQFLGTDEGERRRFYQVLPRIQGDQGKDQDANDAKFKLFDSTRSDTIELRLSKLYSGTQVADALASVLLSLASIMSLPRTERSHFPLVNLTPTGPLQHSMALPPTARWELKDRGYPANNVAQLFLLAPASHGAEGQVWLACDTGQRMCALKIFFKEANEKRKEQEMVLWNKVFHSMLPDGKRVSGDNPLAFWVKERGDALVTPFLDFNYDPKDLSEDKKTAVRNSIKLLAAHNYLHTDLAWRNVGFAYHKDQPYAFLIDMPYEEKPHGLSRQALEEQMLDDLELAR